jgi:hypothetical protein
MRVSLTLRSIKCEVPICKEPGRRCITFEITKFQDFVHRLSLLHPLPLTIPVPRSSHTCNWFIYVVQCLKWALHGHGFNLRMERDPSSEMPCSFRILILRQWTIFRNLVTPRGLRYVAHFVYFPQEQTEWQLYLRQCIEIVAKVAELAPMETYSLVVSELILSLVFSRRGCRLKHLQDFIEIVLLQCLNVLFSNTCSLISKW